MNCKARYSIVAQGIGLLLLIAFGQARGQQVAVADRPEYFPGDTWRYEFKNWRTAKAGCQYQLAVSSVSPTNVYAEVSYPEGCEVSITAATPVPSKSVQQFDLNLNHFHYSPEAYRTLDFPLHVGKSWKQRWLHHVNGWTYDDEVVATVEAFEKVTTPAGTFDTFRVRLLRTYLGEQGGRPTQSGVLTDTLWYSPQVKNFVKRAHVDGKWDNIVRELVTFSVR